MSFSPPVRDANTLTEVTQHVCVSASVRDVQNEDGAVLLDLRQGICFSMTQVGTKIWELLKEKRSLDEISARLYAEYPEIPCERISQDALQFIRELQAHGLAASEPGRISPGLPKVLLFVRQRATQRISITVCEPRCLFWKALLSLAAFDLFRFGSNFSKAYEFVRGWNVTSRAVSKDISDQVCNAVNRACVWYPKRVLCLQRSTVTTCLLRHYGAPAQMVIGAQTFPFKAHAWTEVNGRPVNERRDVQRLYLVWERC